jgi:hypothetical protein
MSVAAFGQVLVLFSAIAPLSPLIGLTNHNTALFDSDNRTLGSLITMGYVSPFFEDPCSCSCSQAHAMLWGHLPKCYSPLKLIGFSNMAWDVNVRWSTLGMFFMLGSSPHVTP